MVKFIEIQSLCGRYLDHIRKWTKSLTVPRLLLCSKSNKLVATLSMSDDPQI